MAMKFENANLCVYSTWHKARSILSAQETVATIVIAAAFLIAVREGVWSVSSRPDRSLGKSQWKGLLEPFPSSRFYIWKVQKV